MAALRDLVSRTIAAARPREWSEHAADLAERLTEIQAERSTVAAELNRAEAAAAIDPENGAAIAERDTLADRLAALNRDTERLQRALDGARARKAEEDTAKRDSAAQAKRDRFNELLAEYRQHIDAADAALTAFAEHLAAAQRVAEFVADVANGTTGAELAVHRYRAVISHRLQVAGFGASFAIDRAARPALNTVVPNAGWLHRLAKIDNDKGA